MSRFFGWGKLKLTAITEQFGDEATLVARLAPPVMPAPVVPDARGAPLDLDLEATVTPWLRLPAVDYARALAALPQIPLRDWEPRNQGLAAITGKSAETSYVALAGVDVGETLDLVEKLRDALTRGEP